MVRGWSAGRAAAAAALLPIPLIASTRIAVASLRISLLPLGKAVAPRLCESSVGQPKLNAHASGKIHWLAISLGWFELDLLRCPHRCLIKAVAEPAYHSFHLNCT